MFCTHCGSENADLGQYCSRCGKQLLVPGHATLEPNAPHAEIADRPPQERPLISSSALHANFTAWCYFRVGFVLLWAYLVAVAAEKTENMSFFEANLIGYWVGTLLLPFLIAYVVAGRKSKRDWCRFSRWLFWLGLTLPALTYNARPHGPALTSEQKVGQVLRQSLGTAPVSRLGNDNEDQEAAVLRQTLQEVIAAVRRLKKDPRCGDLKPELYSAQSYSTTGIMRSSVSFVQGCLAVDREMLAEMDAGISRGKERINAQPWSQSRKESLWHNFYAGYLEGRSGYGASIEAEEHWANARVSLYSFALSHRNAFAIKNGQLLFNDDASLKRFNELSDAADRSRAEFLKANEDAQRHGREYLGHYGISPGEIK
jgi:hypothetical protein